MTFAEAEQFLYSLSNLPRKEYMADPKQCKVYLKRMQLFLDILDNPEQQIPHYIHIAGTSGKGSVGRFLHSIYGADKQRAGLFVSPHPTHITERWMIGNKHMSKAAFVRTVQRIQEALDIYIKTSPHDPPSFFEITTAMGLCWFAEQKVDMAILEAGCGGRYDSTNIIPYKDVAVITNIGLDHTHILGTDKETIAYAKAGIIQKRTPAITQEKNKCVLDVIKKEARSKKTTISISKPVYEVAHSDFDGTEFVYSDSYYRITALGEHQVRNAILAIDTAEMLGVKKESIMHGLASTIQPVRMEVAQHKPTIILDSAHNVDKMKTTVQTMEKLAIKGDLHLIVGFCENKDIRKMITLLTSLKPTSIICTRNTTNPFRKTASLTKMQSLFRKALPKASVDITMTPKQALLLSKKRAKRNDTILVTGSLFISGEIRPYLTQNH